MASRDEWNSILEQEEGEMFIMTMVDDIVEKAKKILFDKHISSQIVPYALKSASEMIQDSINFYFYQRDPGNDNPSLWIEDEEFKPVRIDSWATGAVPVRKPVARVKISMDHLKNPTEGEVGTSEKKLKKISKTSSFRTPKPDLVVKLPEPVKLVTPALRRTSVTINPQLKPNRVLPKPKPKGLPKNGVGVVSTPSFQSTSSIKASRFMGAPRSANAAEIMIIRPPKGTDLKAGGKSIGNIGKTQDLKYKMASASPLTNTFGKTKVAVKTNKVAGKVEPTIKNLVKKVASQRSFLSSKKGKSKLATLEEPKIIFPSDNLPGINGFEEDTRAPVPKLIDTMKMVAGVSLKEGDATKSVPLETIKSVTNNQISDLDDEDVFQSTHIEDLEKIVSQAKVFVS